jgi:outer membrane protein assembly factor BamB
MVDWPTYGYDAQRTGESPDTTIASSNVGSLKLVWAHQSDLNGGNEFNLESQPILATKVPVGGTPRDLVYIGGGSGNVYALDAHTGAVLWQDRLAAGSYTCNGTVGPFGVQGTFALDRTNGVVYVPDGVHRIHALDLATGADRWNVDIVAPGTDDGTNTELRAFVHTGLNLVNGKLYAGTSGVCDITPWRGRVAVVDIASHALQNTYFTVANSAPSGIYGGGGVWGWGGVSAEPDGSAVYTGVGNADTSAQSGSFVQAPNETAGLGEHIASFNAGLTSLLDSHAPSQYFFSNPLSAVDIDLSGTPTLFQPPGCPPLLAVQGKEGYLFIYNRRSLGSGPIFEGQFSISSDHAYYMGLPAYSRQTGYLYAAIPTVGSLSGYAPGLVILGPNAGCTGFTVVAHPSFGPNSTDPFFSFIGENPRSSPTVVNDVVFIGTPDGVLWARHAKTGAALWDSASGGAWAKNTSQGDEIRFGPVVDGGMVFVVETESASIYALTVSGSSTASALRGTLATGGTALPAAPVRQHYRTHRHPF